MKDLIRNKQELEYILAKWQAAFELDDYEIKAEFVSFEELNNNRGPNQGLFLSAVTGGYTSAFVIKLANDWSKYKNVGYDPRHDELLIAREMWEIKRKLHRHPKDYQAAYKGV